MVEHSSSHYGSQEAEINRERGQGQDILFKGMPLALHYLLPPARPHLLKFSLLMKIALP
jgi:hypothetical protein